MNKFPLGYKAVTIWATRMNATYALCNACPNVQAHTHTLSKLNWTKQNQQNNYFFIIASNSIRGILLCKLLSNALIIWKLRRAQKLKAIRSTSSENKYRHCRVTMNEGQTEWRWVTKGEGRNGGKKNSRTICTDWLIMGSGAIFQILSQCVWISLSNLIVMRSIWCMYMNVRSTVAIQNIVAPLPNGMSSILPTVNTLRRQLVNKIYILLCTHS